MFGVAKAESKAEAVKQDSNTVTRGPLMTTIVGTACGAGAAIFTVSWIHPIDTIKTRLQIAGEVGRTTK